MRNSDGVLICDICGEHLVYSPNRWTCVDHPNHMQSEIRQPVDDEQQDDDEPGYNYPAIYIDGEQLSYDDYDGEELNRVQVSFPAKENGEQSDADQKAPLGWCNSAAITLDRSDDSVTVSISVGDPRGAFAFTVRRTSDGRLIMHVPTPDSTMLHMPLRQLHNGTYEIGE